MSSDVRIKRIAVQDYYLYELAAIYGVSEYRMKKKIEEHANRIKKKEGSTIYEVETVTLIFKLIKLPSNIQVIKA